MGYCDGSCPCLEGTPAFDESVLEAIEGGCLPSGGEIKNAVKNNSWWECHSHAGEICFGAKVEAKRLGIRIPDKPTAGQQFGNLVTRVYQLNA